MARRRTPKRILIACGLAAGLGLARLASAQEAPAVAPIPPAAPAEADFISRLEQLARENRLPDYEDLRLPAANAVPIESYYIRSMPLMDDDRFTTDVVFAQVPDDAKYARLALKDLLDVAHANNFDLANSRRGVQISMSDVRGAEAFFKPFVDLVADARASQTVNRDINGAPEESDRTEAENYSVGAGIEATQNLATGGAFTATLDENRSEDNFRRKPADWTESTAYDADFDVRFIQPLLRGSGLLTGEGTNIGTASLRQARLNELSSILDDKLTQRDVELGVITRYFQILQVHRQLLVSREAIRERERFLTETRIKYDVGRVAESEILRAQIQFLSEVETAISRIQDLDDAREDLLVILGLPLDTPISLVDITPGLIDRGRLEIPAASDAVQQALDSRMELMQSDIAVSLSEISEEVAHNDVLPELDVDAGYSRFDADDSLGQANSFDNDTIDGGISLRVPLQNIQRREAARRATLRKEQRRTDRESLERTLRQEVLQAHRNVLTTEARLTVLRKQVEQARRNLELINASFDVGFESITEVRLAQDDLFDAETSYSNAVLGYQASLARLYVAMGLPLM